MSAPVLAPEQWGDTTPVATYQLMAQKHRGDAENIFFDIENGSEVSGSFYVTRDNVGLCLYTENDWKFLTCKLLDGAVKNAEGKNMIRQHIAPAVKVEIERGTMLLPRGLLAFDNLSESVLRLKQCCFVA